jgi:hypothetical protein
MTSITIITVLTIIDEMKHGAVNMSKLDSGLWKRMKEIVEVEGRPFSKVDFVPTFNTEGIEFQIKGTTFRNKVSELLRAKKISVVCYSPQAFYTIGEQECSVMMTRTHTGVMSFHDRQRYRHLSNDPVYRVIQNIPFGRRALHDIRLRFNVNGIWSKMPIEYKRIPQSDDIQIPPWPWKIKDLDIRVTVHSTDTVSIIIGCSYSPVAVDISGVVRLSNALSTVQKRLSNVVNTNAHGQSTVIPDHMSWIVTMWHIGVDSSITYDREMFYTSWEVAEHAFITAYSKKWKDNKTRVRIEKQEYPRISLAEALEEKLNGC